MLRVDFTRVNTAYVKIPHKTTNVKRLHKSLQC